MSDFGIRKSLLIKMVPAKKMRFQSSVHLPKAQSVGFLTLREGNMGGAVLVKTQTLSKIPLMTTMYKAETISPKAKGTM